MHRHGRNTRRARRGSGHGMKPNAPTRTRRPIATEIEVGLPHELTEAQRKELLSEFVQRIVEKHGVFADAAIHTAHDERNDHAHVLLSHRELGPEGFGEIANRRTITRKHRGEVKEMTTAGIGSTPAEIRKLREQWAQDVNRAYEQAGLAVRVDHRSFDDRGSKETPTIHLGPTASKMEREGQRSDRGDINRMIEVGNAEVRRLEAEKQQAQAEIINFEAARAERQAQEAARRRRQPENEDMAEDIAAKQRQQRQEIEDREAARYNDMVAERNKTDRFIQE